MKRDLKVILFKYAVVSLVNGLLLTFSARYGIPLFIGVPLMLVGLYVVITSDTEEIIRSIYVYSSLALMGIMISNYVQEWNYLGFLDYHKPHPRIETGELHQIQDKYGEYLVECVAEEGEKVNYAKVHSTVITKYIREDNSRFGKLIEKVRPLLENDTIYHLEYTSFDNWYRLNKRKDILQER